MSIAQLFDHKRSLYDNLLGVQNKFARLQTKLIIKSYILIKMFQFM